MVGVTVLVATFGWTPSSFTIAVDFFRTERNSSSVEATTVLVAGAGCDGFSEVEVAALNGRTRLRPAFASAENMSVGDDAVVGATVVAGASVIDVSGFAAATDVCGAAAIADFVV